MQEEKQRPPPPPIEIPQLDVSPAVSPGIPFTPLSLQTPILSSGDGGLFSPISPLKGFPITNGLLSPGSEAFLFSPKKDSGDESFK